MSNARSAPDADGRVYNSYQNQQAMFAQVTDAMFALGFGLSNGCALEELQYSQLKVTLLNGSAAQRDGFQRVSCP